MKTKPYSEMTETERAEQKARFKQARRDARLMTWGPRAGLTGAIGDMNYQLDKNEQSRISTLEGGFRPGARAWLCRYFLLAWAYLRGLPYRRVERSTRTQVLVGGSTIVHNLPRADRLALVIGLYTPGFADRVDEVMADAKAWLDNPNGAISAPAPRPKKPYVAAGLETASCAAE